MQHILLTNYIADRDLVSDLSKEIRELVVRPYYYILCEENGAAYIQDLLTGAMVPLELVIEFYTRVLRVRLYYNGVDLADYTELNSVDSREITILSNSDIHKEDVESFFTEYGLNVDSNKAEQQVFFYELVQNMDVAYLRSAIVERPYANLLKSSKDREYFDIYKTFSSKNSTIRFDNEIINFPTSLLNFYKSVIVPYRYNSRIRLFTNSTGVAFLTFHENSL